METQQTTVGYEAADMATQGADQFRAGQESVINPKTPAERLLMATKLIEDITVPDQETNDEAAGLAEDLRYAYVSLQRLAAQLDGEKARIATGFEIAGDAGSALQEICYGSAYNAGWWIDTETGQDVRSWPEKFLSLWVSAKLALVHSEVSEGLEGHRKSLRDDKLPHRPMLEVELADAVIRIFDLAGGLGMDIGGAIREKLAFNATREDHKVENRLKEGGKSF